jgi:hypothetical protein
MMHLLPPRQQWQSWTKWQQSQLQLAGHTQHASCYGSNHWQLKQQQQQQQQQYNSNDRR